ncbi:class E sortase [Prauserella sp. PE36]|uniref:class E sortase n=1 Tax=Prauserella sp. PE36 TaxID=1504709 RepID=UPI000D96D2FD|nr:class E sortase [Prauserella sp. PE36]PXY28900.1 hypothetical protein BAY59_14640 [Prauserella coralliicola]RBM17222.1 class E sortase [Prauserella sp. PE36]
MTDVTRPGRIAATAPPGTGRTALVLAGELLVVLGVVAALFVGYQLWGKPARVQALQEQLDEQLTESWRGATVPEGTTAGDALAQGAGESPAVEVGSPFARLHLPALGLRWAVVEGVSLDDLRAGPGHYPGSALPGELGNVAIAGHRSPGVFWDLHRLGDGDDVVVETARHRFTYRIYDSVVVRPTDTSVIAPDPATGGDLPAGRLLTLTTCNPQWGNWERLVVHAKLVSTEDKSLLGTGVVTS